MIPENMSTKGLTDNQLAIDILYALGGTKLSKFIDLRHNFIQIELKKEALSTTMYHLKR